MFKGIGTALVTPFDVSGKVDYDGLRRLIDHQIQGGIDYLVVMGTTGEPATLEASEQHEILSKIKTYNNGKLKIVYGIGGNNTASVCKAIEDLDKTGVDAILSVSPYYNKPTQKGIIAHYTAINNTSDLPVIIYNVPGRTSSNISAETILKLSELRNMVAVKEASGDLGQIMEIIASTKPEFDVILGDDLITLPCIACGASGAISVISNAYPAIFSKMVHSALNDDMAAARKNHYQLLRMMDLIFREGNPGGVKEALKAQGICDSFMRLPLVPISDNLRQTIVEENSTILD